MSLDAIPNSERSHPAAIAYDLMRDILFDDPTRPQPTSPDYRDYLLDLYAECLIAVRGKRTMGQRPKPRLAPRACEEAA